MELCIYLLRLTRQITNKIREVCKYLLSITSCYFNSLIRKGYLLLNLHSCPKLIHLVVHGLILIRWDTLYLVSQSSVLVFISGVNGRINKLTILIPKFNNRRLNQKEKELQLTHQILVLMKWSACFKKWKNLRHKLLRCLEQ